LTQNVLSLSLSKIRETINWKEKKGRKEKRKGRKKGKQEKRKERTKRERIMTFAYKGAFFWEL
jgi:hypothetical protein